MTEARDGIDMVNNPIAMKTPELIKAKMVARAQYAAIQNGTVVTEDDEKALESIIRTAIFISVEAKTTQELEAAKQAYGYASEHFKHVCPDFYEAVCVSEEQWQFIRDILLPLVVRSFISGQKETISDFS